MEKENNNAKLLQAIDNLREHVTNIKYAEQLFEVNAMIDEVIIEYDSYSANAVWELPHTPL